MKVSISQPTLYPWIGYFNLIKSSDIFVYLDNVSFKKQSWHMRNRVKSSAKIDESEIWLHIPTNAESSSSLIKDVLIDNTQDWKKKHQDILQYNYGNKYKELAFLDDIYKKDWEKIADFNIALISECCKFLEIDTKLIRGSELEVTGKKSNLILNTCIEVGADVLIANSGSKIYLEKDKEIFEKENIKLEYHNYSPIKYSQKGDLFIENLSILDLLFSEGKNSKHFI